MAQVTRRTLFLVFVFVWSQPLLAQESAKYEKYKQNTNYRAGYILTWGNQKIEGLIKDAIWGATSGSSGAIFVSKDGKKKTYGPLDIKGYGFFSTEFISDTKNFYEVVWKGPRVSLYKANRVVFMSTPGGSPSSAVVETMYLMKANDIELFEVKRLEFASEVSTYFSDCLELAKSISNRDLRFSDLNEIVRRYNVCK